MNYLDYQRLALLSHMHAAYSALTHGLLGRWTFCQELYMSGISDLFSPLEQSIRLHQLPALFGKCTFSDIERQLISMPSCLGGLGIINPCVSSAFQFEASQRVTHPLVSLLLEQDFQFTVSTLNEQLALKREIHYENRRRSEESAASLHSLLLNELQRARELACLKGASSWLTVLLLDEHGFSLHKGVFCDAVCLRYMAGHYLTCQRNVYVAPHLLLITHLLVPMVAIRPSATMTEIRDISAQLMSEVCPNVAIEPTLQPVTNEHFSHQSANTETGARLDVRAQRFWGIYHQQAYFDIRVFNPLAASNRCSTISTCF